jgi:hypothetical protein
MYADQAPERSPRITDHVEAQRFIRDWVDRYCYRQNHIEPAKVNFHQQVSSCAVKILFPQDSRQGPVASNTMFSYDLARELTEGMLRNMCIAAVEPIDAWPDRDSKWKGELQ